MRRVVSVWLPMLPTDRLRRNGAVPISTSPRSVEPRPDRPITEQPAPSVTVDRVNRRRVVISVDAAARDAGIVPGELLTHARARIPTLVAYQADPAQDCVALGRLTRWMHRYTPLVTADPPDGVSLDTTGCDHLHGGEPALLSDLMTRLGDAGYTARVAVADTPGCAYAVARHGPDPLTIVESGPPAMQAALADLPVEALRLPGDLRDTARRLGLDTIGDLVAQSAPYRAGRGTLAHRIGAELFERLDRVLGLTFEPLMPEPADTCPTFGLSFAEPLSTFESLVAAATVLVGRACDDLARMNSGALRIDVLFEAVDQSSQAIRIEMSHPSRARTHLLQMLIETFARVEAERGIEAMRLIVSASAALTPMQIGMGSDERLPARVTELTDRLTARSVPVWRARIDRHRLPESCVLAVPPVCTSDSVARSPQVKRSPRPCRLLDPPHPIAVVALLPTYPPVQFVWRRQRHKIRHAEGPERVYRRRPVPTIDTPSAEAGADKDGSGGSGWMVRDYFTVEDEAGQRFWLMREGDGVNLEVGALAWFLQGFF